MTGSRLDFTLRRIWDETVTAVPGGHELAATAYVARVSGDRLLHYVAVATATERYAGWQPEDYQAASLRLHRRLRNRMLDAERRHEREHD